MRSPRSTAAVRSVAGASPGASTSGVMAAMKALMRAFVSASHARRFASYFFRSASSRFRLVALTKRFPPFVGGGAGAGGSGGPGA